MPRRIVLLAAVAALLAAAAALNAATADPLLGTWRVTAGGTGTVVVQGTSSLFKLVAGKNGLHLGCVDGNQGDIVGFVELPSRTRLPKGHYSATIGWPGQGCAYSTNLALNGSKLAGDVTLSENDQAGGPFAFERVGAGPATAKTYTWSVSAKTGGSRIAGHGTVSATAAGRVLGAHGTLVVGSQSYSWTATADAPGTVSRGKNGAFHLVLTVDVTQGTCNDKAGVLDVTKGHAEVSGICSTATIAANGRTALR